MASRHVGLPSTLFATMFPFHVAFDRDLKLVQVGEVLTRVCPGLSVGSPLGEHFRIDRPPVPCEFDAIREQARSVFLLQSRHNALQLKGQMVYVERLEVMFFLSLPWVTDVTALGDLGLTLDDFPIHNPVAELLFLLQAQETALADAKQLTTRLTRQRAELRRANRQLATLYEVSQEITAQVAFAPTLQLIVERARQLLPAEVSLLALRQEASETFAVQAHSGTVPRALAELRLRAGEGFGGRVALTSLPLIVGDYLQEYRHSPFLEAVQASGLRSGVAVPLKTHDVVLGVLYVYSRTPHKFGEEDRQLLSALAHQATIAIENARLYEQVRRHAEELEAKVEVRTRDLQEANARGQRPGASNASARSAVARGSATHHSGHERRISSVWKECITDTIA